MARFKANRLPNMLAFNGTSDYLTLPITPAVTGFNIAFWSIKRNPTTNARIIDCQDSGPANGFAVVEIAGGKSEFVNRNSTTTTSALDSVVKQNGKLTHHVFTFDGTVAKLYENGVLLVQDTSATMSAFAVTFTVGRRATGATNYWNGKIGELVFHDTATPWTQEQITALYYRGEIPSGASYWLFQDNVLDGSGNGKNGTLASGTYVDMNAPKTAATRTGTVRENYEIDAGTLLEGFQTIGDWTRSSAAGSIAEDTEHFTEGDQSLKIIHESGTAVFYDKTISAVVPGGFRSVMLKVYVPSLTDFGGITVYLASASNFSKYFSKSFAAAVFHEGYNYIPIAPSEWSNTGSESWANTMVRLRIRLNATAGTPSCSFCSIHTRQNNRAKLLLTFDDSWDSQYSKAFAYMSTLGLKGTIYAIGSKLGTAGYCTLANLQEMYAAGWDIGNHGSVNLTTLETKALQEAEISGEEAYISEFTRSKKHYAYPMGGYDDNALLSLASLGYKTARTIIDRQQANYLDEKYLLTRYGVYNTTSVASAKGYIDRAIQQGSAVLLNYHIIVDADADVSTKVLTADFNEVMDYIKTKVTGGFLDVVTISEWYNGLHGRKPLVTARTAV